MSFPLSGVSHVFLLYPDSLSLVNCLKGIALIPDLYWIFVFLLKAATMSRSSIFVASLLKIKGIILTHIKFLPDSQENIEKINGKKSFLALRLLLFSLGAMK